jgi:hypothetical protein
VLTLNFKLSHYPKPEIIDKPFDPMQSSLAGGAFNESPQYRLKTAIAAAVAVVAVDYHLTLPAPGANPAAK